MVNISENFLNVKTIKSVPEEIVDKLIQLIVDGQLPLGSKLPSEEQLSKLMGVSRQSLRSALIHLELQGYVDRKYGVGTFVVKNPFFSRTPGIEYLYSTTEIIKSMKKVPSTVLLGFNPITVDSVIAEKLGIKPGTIATQIKRLRKADNEPFCFDNAIFPVSVIPPDVDQSILKFSLLAYAESVLNTKITHAVSFLIPELCKQEISELLCVPLNAPIIKLTQVHYTQENAPIWYSELWHRDLERVFHVTRLRQLIYRG